MRNCVPRVSSGCVALGLCVPPPLHLLDDNLCNIFQLLFVASAAAFFIFIFKKNFYCCVCGVLFLVDGIFEEEISG